MVPFVVNRLSICPTLCKLERDESWPPLPRTSHRLDTARKKDCAMTGFTPPLLLAGPVLRKVTPTSVSVWVATSQACDVKLDVYGSTAVLKRDADAQIGTVAANLVGGKTRSTVKVGDLLHIAVVTAPITGVPPEV